MDPLVALTLLSMTVMVAVPSWLVVMMFVSPFLANTPIVTWVTVPVFDGLTSMTTSFAGLIMVRPGPDVCCVSQFPPIDTPVDPVEDVTFVPPVVIVTTVVVLFVNVSVTVVVVFAFAAAAFAAFASSCAWSTTVS